MLWEQILERKQEVGRLEREIIEWRDILDTRVDGVMSWLYMYFRRDYRDDTSDRKRRAGGQADDTSD